MTDYGLCRDCQNLHDYGRVCARGQKLYPPAGEKMDKWGIVTIACAGYQKIEEGRRYLG